MFSFAAIFGASFYFFLILSRLCELNILKYYRAKGHNSRTVVFVGNDPAISEMYQTMTEDPSAGYIVKGYYADAEIAKAPDGLKKIGSLKDLNGICRLRLMIPLMENQATLMKYSVAYLIKILNGL